ncbi:protein DEHYDRATION-INDUCED 19-like isoform X2 [Phoenix dactylifera]|uniref:Protein DEHYDRATION-INDUCED 19-like isoform X2 n=1 Tax=Phoenix dactylifera TaxID=42345 RepID=A0A8B7D2M2_PHODC|nr:protein DEHYDRATION-INDUCED 19-like isoform X2 [Phoenix dactylifera]
MDSDLWASRLFADKRHYLLQHRQNPQSDRLGVDDFEMEEEVRPDFPCPHCYGDHDVTSLCYHVEDDHAFESKTARQRQLRRFAIPSSQTLSLLGRDLREAYLQLLLGTGTYRSSNTGASNTSADSFLSSVVLNFPTSETEESLKSSISTTEDAYMKKVRPSKTWKSSLDSSLTHEEREQKQKQAIVRATFVQDLLLSALFGD